MKEEKRTRTNKKINGWKWAFIGLISILFILVFWVLQMIQVAEVNEPNLDEQEQVTEEEMVFNTTINRQDANRVINTYLRSILEDDFERYSIAIDDQLNLIGELEILQFNVPIEFSFDPYVLENGNVQLRASSIQMGALSLPAGTVLNLMANQFEFPSFVAINGADEMVIINLNELSEEHDIRVEMIRINLPEDEIELNLYMHENILIDNFN